MNKKQERMVLLAVRGVFPAPIPLRFESGKKHDFVVLTDFRGHEHRLSVSTSPSTGLENNANHMRQKARRLRDSVVWMPATAPIR